MTTGLTKPKAQPQWVQTPCLRTSLASSDLKKHQALVAFELEVLATKFDRFGWTQGRGSSIHTRLVNDWVEALCSYTLEEIKAACRKANEAQPNKMPHEGHIKSIILRERSKHRPPQADRSMRNVERVSSDQADAILKAAGFAVKRFGAFQ